MNTLRAIGFAVLGLVGGYLLTAILGTMLIPSSPGDSGGTAMGIFFGLAPVGGLIGAVIGVVVASKRRGDPPAA